MYEQDATGVITDTTVTQPSISLHADLEWHLIRILIEYGDQPYQEEGSVAEVVFNTIDSSLINDPMVQTLFQYSLEQFDSTGKMPGMSYFVNNPDPTIKTKIATILNDDFVPSNGWRDIVKIEVPFGKDIYEQDLTSVFRYFELKLVRKALQDNLSKMQNETDINVVLRCMKVHQQLKQKERDLELFVIIKN